VKSVPRGLITRLSEVLDDRWQLFWALLDRIANPPGRTSWGRKQELRCRRLGAHPRDGRVNDQPFVIVPDQRALLGKLAQGLTVAMESSP